MLTVRVRAVVELDVEVAGWSSTIDTSDVCDATRAQLDDQAVELVDVVEWRELGED